MKNLLQWIRNMYTRYTIQPVSLADQRQYNKFEQALSEGDVEAYVYEEYGRKGQVVLLKGEDLHMVTPTNLISFRKLNRRDSRYIRSKYKNQLA